MDIKESRFCHVSWNQYKPQRCDWWQFPVWHPPGRISEGNDQLIIRRNDSISKKTYIQDIDRQGNPIWFHIDRNVSKFSSLVADILFYPIDSVGQQAPIQNGAKITNIYSDIEIKNENMHA